MYYIRLLRSFIRIALQQGVTYRFDLLVNVLFSIVNLITAALGLFILFDQVQGIQGWNFASSLILLGGYQILGALRSLFLGPSLNALSGLNGDIWTGRFDFMVLRPANTQFMASCSHWNLLALVDVLPGIVLVMLGNTLLHHTMSLMALLLFVLVCLVSVAVLYAVLLSFAALTFWSPGFLFTWLFDSIWQMARYPVGLYPDWLRLLLTWVVPVGIMTTLPVQALAGSLTISSLLISLVFAAAFCCGASFLFHLGMRRYTSASS